MFSRNKFVWFLGGIAALGLMAYLVGSVALTVASFVVLVAMAATAMARSDYGWHDTARVEISPCQFGCALCADDARPAAAPAPPKCTCYRGSGATVQPNDTLREMWRSVQGPYAELNGPLIRYAGLVWAAALRARPAVLSDDERAETLRSLRWIKEFCEAHHSEEAAGVHLHRLLVDIPHYLDYTIAVLDGPAGGARGEADARERDAGTPQSTGSRAPLSDETLREVAKEWFVASEIPLAMAFARAVLARQQEGR